MPTTDCDLVIVGAGYAGLTCAEAAAARGLKTLVLDRKRAPGARPHTTGILVKEIADAWDFPRRYTRKIHGVRLYSPSLRHIDLTSPGYYFLATDTPAVLRWLAGRAETAGARLRCATPFRQAVREPDRIFLNSPEISCRYLVGSDGARSRVARMFNLGRNTRFLAGVEAEYENVGDLDDDRFHVFLDSQLAPGYIAWVVPGVGVTQVGLAVSRPHVPRLEPFVRKISRLFDFHRARVVSRRGGLIPCGGIVRPLATERVMLIGDSAGMVSPLTAGGIHPAMEIGRAAGIAISDHLLDGAPLPQVALRPVIPSFFYKRLLRAAFDRVPVPDRLTDRLFDSALFRQVAQTVFFHHRGLFSMAAWRDIAHAVIRP